MGWCFGRVNDGKMRLVFSCSDICENRKNSVSCDGLEVEEVE